MRRSAALFFTVLMIPFSACYSREAKLTTREMGVASTSAPAHGESIATEQGHQMGDRTKSQPRSSGAGPVEVERRENQQVSLESAAAAQAVERKVIQNAEMTIEADAPNEGQRKIAAIADKHSGFVVISESKQNEAASHNVASTVVNIVIRVPMRQFEAAKAEIRGVGGRILHEKSSGQDITEEYIDLEARIRTKRALETQFLEIMKQARKISDALEVQTQLANVRTEIERLEGRRRFLENQSALSTIKITLHTPTPVVAAATRGFLYDLKAAFGDGVEVGTDIVLGIIRFVIVMIPVTLFILAPGWFVFKWVRRRIPVQAKAAVASATSQGVSD
jgi:Domain of unknown function (DUF4349)